MRILNALIVHTALSATALWATVLPFTGPAGASFGNGIALPLACGNRVNANSDSTCSYGVGNGFTPGVSVQWGVILSNNTFVETLWRSWTTNYGSLQDVAYRSDGYAVRLTADSGLNVRLNSFDFAGYFADWPAGFSILDGSFNVLFQASGLTGPSTGFQSLSPNISGPVLYLMLNLPVAQGNVGIDNLNFDQVASSPVPEPSTLALLALALSAMLLRSGRRR